MTAVVVLAWAFLALVMAFVVGHGIRLADAHRSTPAVRQEVRPTVRERQAVSAA